MMTQSTVYDITRHYVHDYSHLLGPDLTKTLLGYVRSRSLNSLASASDLFDEHLHTSDTFRCLRQVAAFFKKNASFSEPERCEIAAFESFLDSEKRCRITNRRLSYYYFWRSRLDSDLELQMGKMERFINRVLGPFSGFLGEFPEHIKITSGASATRSRKNSQPYLKLRRYASCTPKAKPYIDVLTRYFGYKPLPVQLINWNRVEAVPKNWKTHRTIACEAEANVPLQLAFDSYAKKRLLKLARVDLSDQSRNQQLAYEGSVSGSLATIDLSAASDSLAFEAVSWLLPTPWFEYLRDIRSSCYRSPMGFGKYAKFSSMGNGATFALETLVFAAASYAVGSKRFSVYGDDIVIETELHEKLIRLLAFLGFRVNEEKSYTSGPFRESCGKDYFSGIDVTPFYIREMSDRKVVMCHNVNGLASIALPEGSLWIYLRELVSSCELPLVPYNGSSPSGIYIDVQTAYAKDLFRTRNGIQEYRAYVSSDKSRSIRDSRTLFLWHLQASKRSSTAMLPTPTGVYMLPSLVKGETRSYQKVVVTNLPDERINLGTIQSSRMPTLCHKYRRKWVRWIPPSSATPVHLYWWTDFLMHLTN
mgnify:FL=1